MSSIEDQLVQQATAHHASEALRLAPCAALVDQLHAEERAFSEKFDAFWAFCKQMQRAEEARLAPFRSRVERCERLLNEACHSFNLSINEGNRLVERATEAHEGVLAAQQAAAASAGSAGRPLLMELETARNAERSVFIDMTVASRRHLSDMWFKWQRPLLVALLQKAQSSLAKETARPDAPPLAQTLRELRALEKDHTSLMLGLSAARNELESQKLAGAVAWDLIVARVYGGLS